MKKLILKTVGIWLSLVMIVMLLPAGRGWAEDPDRIEDMTEAAAEPAASEIPESGTGEEPEDPAPKRAQINDVTNITVDDPEHGTLIVDQDGIHGTATPDTGYDLATIRMLHSDGSEEYIDYAKEGGSYIFTIDASADDCRLTAFFFSLTKWDGAVDLTWYDPQERSFDISTPAQLAGLAAITNGMVDQYNTEEWMIKDPDGRELNEDGKYTHRYISTEPWDAYLLTPNTDAAVTDTVWRLTKHDAIIAEDDCYHDFRYRTINITADIDMTGDRVVTDGQTSETRQLNWTPIGGKYAMNPEETVSGVEAKVVDTRFQGVFNGNGHTITIHCNRYAKMGFAYSWAVGVIGYLGGGVDYKNGYPKDTFVEYDQPWVPTARDLIVRGDVLGRRMAGGVIGRTGETNYGVVVERCANYATVRATDMRGCAGIVAAAWGDTVIRQCYNAGTIKSAYAEHGGIVGSNGYEGSGSYEGRTDFRAEGADIYDCYDIGDTTLYYPDTEEYRYDGHEIGIDGEAFAKYTVANCFYLTPQSQIDEKKIGYCRGEVSTNTRAKCRNVTAVDDMNDAEVLAQLNQNGNVFVPDTTGINSGINGGGPVLYFQGGASQGASSTLTVGNSTNGTVTASDTGTLAYGTTVGLKASPNNTSEQKYRFNSYLIQDGNEEKTPQYGDFYTITGNNVTVGAVFEETSGVSITFAEINDVHVHYYVDVTKVYDVDTGECEVALHSEDRVNVGDRIKLIPHMKETFKNKDGEEEPVHPDLKTLEYTGDISNASFEEGALERTSALSKIYTVTGETDEINVEYALKTQGKRWTSTADTSWYQEDGKAFTLTTAKQLAGIAVLCEDGVSFKGVTLKLGNDISLENTRDNSGDKYPSERSWIGIGTDRHPFEGTFDGQGHTIKYMTRNFYVGYCPGSNGGLFGVTENAVIKNVTVEGGSYENKDDDPDKPAVLRCAFKNGAKGGGIVGEAINSTISNCHCSINMEEASIAGGIVGTAEGSTTVADCSFTGAFSEARNNVGGIVGRLEGSGARIERCANKGAISALSNNVGGILGYGGTGSATVKQCVNEGNIDVAMQGSTTQQSGSAGGILGYSGGVLSCVESYNKGNVRGEKRTVALGGIAGAVSKATIKDCYNMGDVYSNSEQGAAQIAGIANLGFSNSNHASLINCYNAGQISTGDKFTSNDRRGGVAGYGNTTTNTISNCYCSASSVAQIGNTAGIAGTVLSDIDMQRAAGRLGAGFAADAKKINNGYPVLLWQDPDFIGGASLTSVTRSSDTSILVSWSGWGNCTGYQVYQSTSAGGTYSKVGDVPQGAALNVNVTGLAYGLTYYYRVLPYRVVDGAVYYGAWTSIGSASLMPDTVTLTSVKNKKSRTAVLKWKRVSGAGGYQIYRSMKPNKGFKKIATIKKGKTVTYKNKKLKKGKKYYYKVRAYKKVNKRTGYGAFSATRAVKIKR